MGIMGCICGCMGCICDIMPDMGIIGIISYMGGGSAPYGAARTCVAILAWCGCCPNLLLFCLLLP